jgi:hypothetical protein
VMGSPVMSLASFVVPLVNGESKHPRTLVGCQWP